MCVCPYTLCSGLLSHYTLTLSPPNLNYVIFYNSSRALRFQQIAFGSPNKPDGRVGEWSVEGRGVLVSGVWKGGECVGDGVWKGGECVGDGVGEGVECISE